eukprot:909404-Alexandrium_andersonii.AAC.1
MGHVGVWSLPKGLGFDGLQTALQSWDVCEDGGTDVVWNRKVMQLLDEAGVESDVATELVQAMIRASAF